LYYALQNEVINNFYSFLYYFLILFFFFLFFGNQTYFIVCNDELTHAKKGKTVLNCQERAASLRHCKWVDEVIENAPWVVDQAFLDKHRVSYNSLISRIYLFS